MAAGACSQPVLASLQGPVVVCQEVRGQVCAYLLSHAMVQMQGADLDAFIRRRGEAPL
jgi:hypothetical protein